MKLVLVAGMNPRVSKQGPKVMLSEGWYRICVENRKDCEMILHAGSLPAIPIQDGHVFQSYGEKVSIALQNGSEDYVNIFAELTNGPESSAVTS